jgi:Prophage CP4-57 regulatory protein (AlpA)
MSYLDTRDLLKRWTRPPTGSGVFARQSVYRLMRCADFPAPVIVTGRVRLWHLSDIATFEDAHPELTDADAKWRKIRKAGRRALFAAAQRRKGLSG